MRSILSAVVLALSAVATAPASAAEPAPSKQAAPVEKCEHGVKKSVCARCNPKLEAVYKAKGDWCAEHARPESQCVRCNPALAKEGVK
jgi:serine protease inhibitor ecotin